MLESLDRGRWADAKSGNEAERFAGGFRGCRQNGANKDRHWPVDCTTQNAGMGDRADRTLMAGNLGIVSVDVDGLNHADKGDQDDTHQRQHGKACVLARSVSG